MKTNKSEGIIKDGISFIFEDEGNKICIWGSTLNGKEKVYLNDTIISEKQNFKLKGSSHKFIDSEGNEFEVEFEIKSILKGEIKCTVLKNASKIKTFMAKYNQPKYLKFNIKSLAIFALSGVILGFLDLPEKLFIPIIIAVPIVFFAIKSLTSPAENKGHFIIEEIDG